MSPPGEPPTSLNLQANGESQSGYLSHRILTREAAKVCADLGYHHLHGPRLRLLVSRFIDSGRADLDFRTWFLGYADPTGETAVRNVAKEIGRG